MAVTDRPIQFDLVNPASPTAVADAGMLLTQTCFRTFVNEVSVASDADMARQQSWYWAATWQDGEREADADLEAGRTESFASGDDFLAALHDLAGE